QFRYQEYQDFLNSIRAEAGASKQRQQQAFAEERARWAAAGQAIIIDALEVDGAILDGPGVPDGCQAIVSPLTASVWNIRVEKGQRVQSGERLVVLEAMKTELVVTAPSDGVIREVVCTQGALVTPGQSLMILETA
ncbi:MAG: acetyl-CoA carboxylase biotin carboxyl carrier protein subunit, partial [Bryobacteraceae bacterium]